MHRRGFFIAIHILLLLIIIQACATQKPVKRDVHLPSQEVSKQKNIIVLEEEEARGTFQHIYYSIALWYGFSKAACSLTFDDGTLDHYFLAFPEMERRNLKGTFFLITKFVKKRFWKDGKIRRRVLSWDQAREISEAGHEIGSHSRTHPDMTKRGVNIKRELFSSLSKIKSEIPSIRATTLAWPYWRNNEECQKLAGKYYIAARAGTGVMEDYSQKNILNPQSRIINLFSVDSLSIRGSEINGQWKAYCNSIWEEGRWFVICFHGIDDGRIDREWLGWEPISLLKFREFLDYIISMEFWIAPFGTVSRYIRERDGASLSLKSARNDFFIFLLEDGLDDAIYNQPLSIEIKLPVEWKKLRVTQRRKALLHEVMKDGSIRFSALPDGSDIFIERVE